MSPKRPPVEVTLRNLLNLSTQLLDEATKKIAALEAELTRIKTGQEPVGHLDGLDECAEFMSVALRKGHEARNSSTPKMFTIPVYLAAGAQPVSPGYQLVPVACTKEMADAAWGGEHENWQDFAAQFARAIAAAPVQPQEQRKPLTDEQDRALCEAFYNRAADEYFETRPSLDSALNRRIFYAGHRKAWIRYAAAHGIKEPS